MARIPASVFRGRPAGDLLLGGLLLATLVIVHRDVAAPGRAASAWLLLPLAPGLVLATLGLRRRWRARSRQGLLAGGLALQLILVLWPLVGERQPDATWLADHEDRAHARLDAAVQAARDEHRALARFAEAAVAATDAAALQATGPFELCADWRDAWRAQAPTDHPAPLAAVLWRHDQRVGWAGPVIPGDTAPPADQRRLIRDDRHWALRALASPDTTSGFVLECQLWLADVSERDGVAAPTAIAVRREVVRDARPPGRRAWGDAARGLRLVEDVVLAPPDRHGVRPRLRLSVQVPARDLLEQRWRAAAALAHVVLAGLLLLAWAGPVGAGGFWLMAWLVRGWWAWIDVMHWLTAALPTPGLPASPASPTSLLDPAYFATTLGGGWFASGADALLTALLLVGTAAWTWRRFVPAACEVRPRWGRALLVAAPLAAAVFLALDRLWGDLAANANARLIGLEVPLEAWTFWVLHAVILGISLAVWSLVVLAGLRLLGGVPRVFGGPARPYWLALGLLVVVLANDVILATAYGRAERDWLRRKAAQIIQPQDEWLGFLVEDVLSDMVDRDSFGIDPAVVGPGRGALQRDQLAHRLWQQSAVRDLGLPALVEVLDAAGETESLYATGFLRDFGYEVVSRSAWWALSGPEAAGAASAGVVLQDEVRRYPTGVERVLRGESPRRDDGGWLRLELSAQSLRISTLLSRLTGAQDVRTGGGYRPRLEVDRPVLLVRGDAERWLDAGFVELPGPPTAPALDALREGEREWAEIELEGRRWLCRWASLPAEVATHPGEGFLIGLQRRGVVASLLDLGRLLLLDVILLLAAATLVALARRRWRWVPGFQGRFLLGYLVIGVILLMVAGVLADRQTFQRLEQEARTRTRDGLVTALGQLRGLLGEQARALASSDYIAELLAGRLAGERRLGPFAVRQGMVFGPDGELLLDETLGDLDADDADRLLAAARQGPLVVMRQGADLYLGVAIPIDLGDLLGEANADGTFFYRQRLDDQLLPSLAEVIGGEVVLRLDGEVADASHSGRILEEPGRLLAAPASMQWFREHPGQPRLRTHAGGMTLSGGIALPALSSSPTDGLVSRELPAVLTVEFPGRDRDLAGERRRMALFLAGLITLLLLTALGLALALSWNIFEPLRVLLGATRQLAAGDYTAPLPPGGGDEVGRLASSFRTMRDQLQNAREVLESRERFLRAVLDRVPVGVLVWDRVGRVSAWNPAAYQLLARFYPEQPASEEMEEDIAAWTSRLRRDLAVQLGDGSGELSSDEGRRTMRIGQAPVELGAEQPHRLVVCEDLTEFLAAKKQALNAELARQVAHEIKNPLTPIQLSAQLVQQAHRDGHPRFDAIVDDAVRRILEQVSLLRSIAGEFSLLGRPGELECEPLDLPALVVEVVAGYRSAPAGDGPRIEVSGDAPPLAYGHRESLLKVLGNLMQNSLDAAGGPGALVVEISWKVEPAAVSLVWRDNGPGIGEDVASRLFDPYFSTKSKGTGLGLAICRNLLEKMGGGIGLRNAADGQGAVATVTLPRADAGAGDGDPEQPR